MCRCTQASCGSGGTCEDGGTTCVYADDFDGTTSLLEVCEDGVNNTWAVGTPTVGTCRSIPSCWVTNLQGEYNDCELSCIESP